MMPNPGTNPQPNPPGSRLSGKVVAPEGTIPISGALVYVTGTPPPAIPDGVYCDKCVHLPDGTAYTTTRADGTFELPAGLGSAFLVVQKGAFRRVRPVDLDTVEFRHGLRRPITSSFPSGHATAGFCAATLLGGGAWYGVAAAVAATRVYVRLHHASDVVAGAALGLELGVGLRRAVARRA